MRRCRRFERVVVAERIGAGMPKTLTWLMMPPSITPSPTWMKSLPVPALTVVVISGCVPSTRIVSLPSPALIVIVSKSIGENSIRQAGKSPPAGAVQCRGNRRGHRR